MKQKFIHEDFLLKSPTAVELFHAYARDMPIIDYHCHLPPEEIAGNKQFADLTEIWLKGDHYKWRAMRTAGVDEHNITGGAPARTKFDHWAATVPKTLRNPLYHWTHLEMARYFGIDDMLLSPATADAVWERANAFLATGDGRARSLIVNSNVVLVCTTDDPVDSLVYHKQIAADSSFPVKVLPAFRPDNVLFVSDPIWDGWIKKLGKVSGIAIDDFPSLMAALKNRCEFFHSMGCRLSDHGFETLYVEDCTEDEANRIFKALLAGNSVTDAERLKYFSRVLLELGRIYHALNWTQQFHLGADRSNNTRMLKQLGKHTGYDCIGDFAIGSPLVRYFDSLDSTDQLARTIVYNLNPRDNDLVATIIGSFQSGGIAGKMQMGSGWWFLDQIEGMTAQMNSLSNMGLLSEFVGMLTDSRSFLSYPRHEYFRRLLCNILGGEMEDGRLPMDIELVGNMVRDICYRNAEKYFRFEMNPKPAEVA